MSILNGTWWSFFCFSTIIEWISSVPPLMAWLACRKHDSKAGWHSRVSLTNMSWSQLFSGLFRYDLFIRQQNIFENGRIFLNLFFACFSSNFGLKKFIKSSWLLKPSFSESKFSKISYDCSMMYLLFLKGLFAHR